MRYLTWMFSVLAVLAGASVAAMPATAAATAPAVAAMATSTPAPAPTTTVASPPLAESRCAPGGLVDAKFRDAALVALNRLVVRAPGRSAHGAVRSHHSVGYLDAQGHAWQQVSAYQVNLGLIGALRVAPQLLPVVADWLRWQARHIAPVGPHRGVVIDHWVRTDNFEESSCPAGVSLILCDAVDAFDSTAATTLLMADAYLRHGGDVALLRDPAMRQALEAAAATLGVLSVADGLSLAKPTHPIVYTMDVVEVVAGWRAWARLQRDAYAQPASGNNSVAAAARAEEGLRHHLWDEGSQAWRVNIGADAPQRSRWYPDTVAQAWPLLWGTDAGPTERAGKAWRAAIAPWQRKPHWADTNADPDGFFWPAVAVAARCTGDEAGARIWVARARARWLDPKSPFAWPFQVGDLLWLLWLADPPGPASTAPSPPLRSSNSDSAEFPVFALNPVPPGEVP